MRLFSRKEKHPKGQQQPTLAMDRSSASISSINSSRKSPDISHSTCLHRASNGSSHPTTPLTPFSQAHMPKIDLPRPPDPQLDPVGYLRSLPAVRERCIILTNLALKNQLRHFDVDMSKFDDVVMFVAGIIKVN